MDDKRDIVIKGENIYFSYEGVKVLKNCSFYIRNKDFAAVVGPNGAGKSTLLKICLGLFKPDKGRVLLFETPIDEFDDWDKIGYVPQKILNLNLGFPGTVEEVVSSPLYIVKKLKNLSKRDKIYLTDRALEAVGMQDYKKRLIGNLSAGQQQRVFIAKALINSPELLFLDEPTTGIDNKTEEEFYDLIYKLNKEKGITIVMVTHDYSDIKSMVNRVLQVRDGCVIDNFQIDEDGDKK